MNVPALVALVAVRNCGARGVMPGVYYDDGVRANFPSAFIPPPCSGWPSCCSWCCTTRCWEPPGSAYNVNARRAIADDVMNELMLGLDTVCATGRCAVLLRAHGCARAWLRTMGMSQLLLCSRVLLEHGQVRVLAVRGVEYGHRQVGAGLHEQRVLL